MLKPVHSTHPFFMAESEALNGEIIDSRRAPSYRLIIITISQHSADVGYQLTDFVRLGLKQALNSFGYL